MSSEQVELSLPEARRLGERVGAVLGVLERSERDAVLAEAPVRVGLACGRFNGGVTLRLLEGALAALADAGAAVAGTSLCWVPGAFELPLAAAALAASGTVDAVVALGAVVRGETAHFEFVAGQCAAGLQQVQLQYRLPVAFGVLTTEDLDQALARSGPGPTNKGYEACAGALDTVALLRRVATTAGD
ncbi:6,7-dimethyl-8-ribityllumazine synthase [Aciditerrimonas ferrireducens]|jgi:6,7-dimethyl-8-ribityllumazine synthase|uniref:6,7-dimethyl-8-ribityllumazine synthase n=1 Tax=Aciditerrimonas ferrireducens TaxID=667306 RepID=A0ABV6C7W0_9ACTN|nr:6,7-dimethyl-8-ribityllumazine synthase [Aciditerrimonas ferrireducens]MCK4177369.1 6,7-dimethyl-8-ribityllumazine synthase [Aciditerrimonas ferrireducens]